MKKVALAFVLLLAVAVAALLVAPSFWDWNAEKGRIAALVKEHTGRDLEIAGNVSLHLLPRPAFAAREVTLANLEGGSGPAMVQLEELQISVALLPLLRGEILVESVTLVKPQVLLEVLADGRANWRFGPAPAPGSGSAEESERGQGGGGPDQAIRVDSFLIEDGTVRYRDARSGREEILDGLNAELAADSLSGPFAASGAAVYHGVPLAFDFNLGQLVEAGATALSLSLKLPQAEAEATFIGALSRHEDLQTLRGRLQAEGGDLAGVLRALAIEGGSVDTGGAASGILAQAFTATAELSASSSEAAAESVKLTLGPLSLDGRLVATLDTVTGAPSGAPSGTPSGTGPDITAELSAKTVDLDKLLALQATARPPGAPAEGRAADAPPVAVAVLPGATPAAEESAGLPRGFSASIALGADALLYRGQTVRQLQVAARLEDGRLTLTQAAVQLPGSSKAALTGVLSTDGQGPRFSGKVTAESGNLRGMLQWLGVDVAAVPAERLRRMVLKTGLDASGDQLVLRNTDIQLDLSRVTGGAAVALRKRPGFGIALSVDKINLDAYLPAPGPEREGPAATAEQAAPLASPLTSGPAPAAAPLGLPVLGRFDANIDLRVGQMTYRGLPLDGLHLDATLQRGGLVVRNLAVADLVGSRGQFTGSLANVDRDASIDGSLDVSVTALSRLTKAFGVSTARQLPLESFTLSGAVNGNGEVLRFDQRLTALGGTLRAAGAATLQPAAGGAPSIDTALELNHPDLNVLLGELLRDAALPRDLGPAAVKGRLAASASDIRLSGLEGTLAGVDLLGGDIALSLAGPRPRITAQLSTGQLPLAAVMAPVAAGSKATENSSGGAGSGSGSGLGTTAAGHERWSRQAFDLEGLRAFDGEVKLTAKTLLIDRLRLTDAEIEAVLADGVLDLQRFAAGAYGGALSLTGKADARETAVPGLDIALALSAADVELKGLLGDLADSDRFSGPVTLKSTLTSRGASEAALVSALAGDGTLAGTVTVAAKVEEQAGALVLGILGKKVKEIRGVTDSTTVLFSAFAGAPAAIDGSFVIAEGVARSDDLTLRGRDAVARTVGSVDLPGWRLDSTTDVFRDADPAKAYLTAKLKGPLDAPNVAIGGQPFQRNEAPAAGETSAGETSGEQPEQPAKPLKPEDILKEGVKGLLKGLGG